VPIRLDLFALHQVSELHTQSWARAVGFDLAKAFLIYPNGQRGSRVRSIVLGKGRGGRARVAGATTSCSGLGSGLNCTVAGVTW